MVDDAADDDEDSDDDADDPDFVPTGSNGKGKQPARKGLATKTGQAAAKGKLSANKGKLVAQDEQREPAKKRRRC